MKDELSQLEQVRNAITNLRRGNQRLYIATIAEKAGIARRTIYNRPELKQLCDQAIKLQNLKVDPETIAEDSSGGNQQVRRVNTKYENLEHRYKNLRELYKKEQEKNAILLHNNKTVVLEKEQLKSKIVMLEEKIERINMSKVKNIK